MHVETFMFHVNFFKKSSNICYKPLSISSSSSVTDRCGHTENSKWKLKIIKKSSKTQNILNLWFRTVHYRHESLGLADSNLECLYL